MPPTKENKPKLPLFSYLEEEFVLQDYLDQPALIARLHKDLVLCASYAEELAATVEAIQEEDLETDLERRLKERDAFYQELAAEQEKLLIDSIEQSRKLSSLERDLHATRDKLRRAEDELHLREFKASLGFRTATSMMIGAICCYIFAMFLFTYAANTVLPQSAARGWGYLGISIFIFLIAIYASFKTLQSMEVNSPDLQASKARTQPAG